MDKGTTTTLERLAIAERLVAHGKKIIDRQRALIARLEIRGLDTAPARYLLARLEEAQTMHESDYQRLLEASKEA